MSFWQRLFRRRETAGDPRFVIEASTLQESVRLVTAGLSDLGVRELELVDVPPDLFAEARELLTLLASRAIEEKPERDGATIGGPLLDATQTSIHIATLRIAAESTTPGARELFRVVDYGERVDARLPRRLLATHLAMIASSRGSLRAREKMARRSIELFPGEAANEPTQERFDRGENVGNFLGWEALGDVLFERGSSDEAQRALHAATERCPAWAADFAQHVAAHVPSSSDPRMRFWLEYARNVKSAE